VIKLNNSDEATWTNDERLRVISRILEDECPRQGPGENCDLAELPASKIREIGERIYFLAKMNQSYVEFQRAFIIGTGEKRT